MATLCDPIDGSPPGSVVPGILQARILEWVAISFSNAGKWKVKVKSLSCVRLLVTPWTAAYQAPPSMGFSRQEYAILNSIIFYIFMLSFLKLQSKIMSSISNLEDVWLFWCSLGGGGGLVAKLCPTLATSWTVARQAPLPMGFSRQEYWSGLSFPSPGDLPNLGIEPRSPALQADSLPTKLWEKPDVALLWANGYISP